MSDRGDHSRPSSRGKPDCGVLAPLRGLCADGMARQVAVAYPVASAGDGSNNLEASANGVDMRTMVRWISLATVLLAAGLPFGVAGRLAAQTPSNTGISRHSSKAVAAESD